MNGQEPDIERLLKAAAQQEPEPAPLAVKQQAWEQLRHRLDNGEVPPPPPSGRGWWFVLAGAIILLGLGWVLVFQGGNDSRVKLDQEIVMDNEGMRDSGTLVEDRVIRDSGME